MSSVENPAPRTRILRSALVSIVFLAVGVGVYVFFLRTVTGQQLDASSFGAVVWLRSGSGTGAARLRTALLLASVAIFVLLLLVALLRRRVRDSAIALIVAVIALLLSGGLKDFVVVRPDVGHFGYAYNTFPSGHETITVAALIGAYLLLPDGIRKPVMVLPLLVLGTASGALQVIAYAHRPSDVIAAALLAGAVAAWIPGRPTGVGRVWRVVLWSIVALTAIGGIAALANWQLSQYATSMEVVGTVGIVLCSAAAVGSALLVVAERGTGPRRVGSRGSSAAGEASD